MKTLFALWLLVFAPDLRAAEKEIIGGLEDVKEINLQPSDLGQQNTKPFSQSSETNGLASPVHAAPATTPAAVQQIVTTAAGPDPRTTTFDYFAAVNPLHLGEGRVSLEISRPLTEKWRIGGLLGKGHVAGGSGQSSTWGNYLYSDDRKYKVDTLGVRVDRYRDGFANDSWYLGLGVFLFSMQATADVQDRGIAQTYSGSTSGRGAMVALGYHWFWSSGLNVRVGLQIVNSESLRTYPEMSSATGAKLAPIPIWNPFQSDIVLGYVF